MGSKNTGMDKLFKYIKPKNLVDIGANIGNFTKDIYYTFPSCKAIMVEANPNCEPYLRLLGRPYDIVALSNKEDKDISLYIEKINLISTGCSLYKEKTEWYSEGKYDIIKVSTKTLDSRNYYDDDYIDLIKIDVQGSEYDILLGGLDTLKRTNYVLIETSLVEYNEGSPLVADIITLMKQYDFMIEDIIEYHRFEHLYNGAIFQMDILFKNKKASF